MSESTSYPDIPNKSFLRPDEIAGIFGVTVRTVYDWHSEGKLEGLNPTGKCLRFERPVVINFMLSRSS